MCCVFTSLNCRSSGFILEGFPSTEEELRFVAEKGTVCTHSTQGIDLCVSFVYITSIMSVGEKMRSN